MSELENRSNTSKNINHSKISNYFRDLLDAVRKWEEEEFAGGKVLFTYQMIKIISIIT